MTGLRFRRAVWAVLALKVAARRMAGRPLRCGVAVVAVAAGVSTAATVLVVRASVDESVARARSSVSGLADLRVTGLPRRAGLGTDAVDRAASVAGVRSAAGVVEAVTIVQPPGGGVPVTVAVLGSDCRLAAASACVPALVDTAGTTPLARGPDVPARGRLRTAGGHLRLDGVPVVPEFAAVGAGNLVVMSLDGAQSAFERGDRLDAVYVRAEPGAGLGDVRAGLAAALGRDVQVGSAGDAPASLAPALGHFLPISALLAAFALLLGGAFAYTTLSMSLAEGRREVAIARSVGASRAFVRTTFLVEAVAIGLLGGFAGAIVGPLAADPVVDSLSLAVREVANVDLSVQRPARLGLTGAAVGVVIAALAALPIVRKAGRRDLVPALTQREEEPIGRPVGNALVWGSVAAFGVVAVSVASDGAPGQAWTLPLGLAGFGSLTVTLLFGGAELLAAAGRRLLGHRVRRRLAAVSLGAGNLSRFPRRTASVVTVVTAVLVSAFVLGGFVEANRSGTAARLEDRAAGTVRVSVPGVEVPDRLDVGLAPAVVDRLIALPEVGAAVRHAPGYLAGYGEVTVRADVAGRAGVGGVGQDGPRPGEAVLSRELARGFDVGAGDRLVLRGRSAALRLVVRSVTDGDGEARSVAIDGRTFVEAFGREPVTSLDVAPAEGVTADGLVSAVNAAAPGEIEALLPEERAAASTSRLYRLLEPYRVLQAWLLFLGTVAMSSTITLSGLQRRREVGLLRAVGLTRGGVAGMVVTESLLVWLMSVLLGSVASPVLLRAFLAIESLLVGVRDPYRPVWGAFGSTSAIVLGLAVAMATWSAVYVTRRSLVDALRAEP